MLSRAAEAAAGKVKILGVTVLTSLAEDDLRAEGIEQTIPEMVRARARIAARGRDRGAGLLAARDRGGARARRRACCIVVPGIRPAAGRGRGEGRSEARRDRRRRRSRRAPTTWWSGGPIRDAADPAAAFDGVVREVEAAV